jgi:signal transduction histidine kinase
MPENETVKPVVTPREARLSWRVIAVLGIVALVLLRAFAREVGMPIWVANLLWICTALVLLLMRARTTGFNAIREDATRGWQRITDWLAVTGWGRLLAVALLSLITVSIVLDADEIPALIVAALFGLAALKLAQGTRRKPLADPAAAGSPKSAKAKSAGATAAEGNWLQRLSWPRLMLIGLLLLVAAGIANHMMEPDEHSLISIDSDTPKTVEKAREAADKAREAADKAREKAQDAAERAREKAQEAAEKAREKVGATDTEAEPAEPPEPPAAAESGAAAEAGASAGSAAPSSSASSSADGGKHGATSVSIGTNGILVTKVGTDGKTKKIVRIGPQGVQTADSADGEDVDIKLPEIKGVTADEAREIHEEIRAAIASAREQALSSRRGFDFASLAFIAIVSLIIMKLLAGGKRRAELDADSARVAADIARLEREAADAKLHAMQAQIEPHFLFNTLASVDQLIQTDPPRASQVQKTLIQYLRAAIPQIRDDAQRSSLGRQVTMSRAYLEIMQVRMEERLAFGIQVPEGLMGAEFPSMMLQTLIENCIKHGLEPKPEGGRIDLTAEVTRGKLRVQISDTGVGLKNDRRDGVGLANIRERLALLYDDAAMLSVVPNPAGGTIAIIEVPYKDEAEKASRDEAGRGPTNA